MASLADQRATSDSPLPGSSGRAVGPPGTPGTVRLDHLDGGVEVVTFDIPERLNAMSASFVRELSATLKEIASDRSSRVVVITGAGRGFSAGHDLGELSDLENGDVRSWDENQSLFSELILQINEMPVPTIAAVNGAAAGGGLAMALACDTRLCTPSARFNAAFIRLGVSGCDVGVSYLLPRIVGPTLAFEMMLSGRLIDAEEAHRAGLVLRVTPEGGVVDAAVEVARTIERNAPLAVQMTKRVMWANLNAPSLRFAIELENRTQVLCLATEDHREALDAFLGKRNPRFGGS